MAAPKGCAKRSNGRSNPESSQIRLNLVPCGSVWNGTQLRDQAPIGASYTSSGQRSGIEMVTTPAFSPDPRSDLLHLNYRPGSISFFKKGGFKTEAGGLLCRCDHWWGRWPGHARCGLEFPLRLGPRELPRCDRYCLERLLPVRR